MEEQVSGQQTESQYSTVAGNGSQQKVLLFTLSFTSDLEDKGDDSVGTPKEE